MLHLLDDLRRAEDLLADTAPIEAQAVAWALRVLAEQGDPAANAKGKVRGDHGDTADNAAWAVLPRSGTRRMEVLRLVIRADARGLDGLTDVEIQGLLDMVPNTERPRRVELVEGGWLRDSGNRREHNGRDHIVWALTEKARGVEVAA